MEDCFKMTRTIFTLLILLQGICSSAQTPAGTDSLLKQLPAAKEDSNKVLLLLRVAERYGDHDLKNAKAYSRLALALSRKINFKYGVLQSCKDLSDAFLQEGIFDSSLAVHLISVDYFKKADHPLNLALSLFNVAISYFKLGQYENAITSIEQSRKIFEQLGDRRKEGYIYNLLQAVANDMHQYRKGISYGLKAIATLRADHDKEYLCYSYNNLGLNYICVQSYDSAKFHLRKAYEIALANDLTLVKTLYHLNMGLIALRQQNPDSLYYYAIHALEESRKSRMNEQMSAALYGLSSYYLSRKDYTRTKLYADSSMQLAELYHLRRNKRQLYPLLSNYYFAIQNTKMGSYYAQQDELLRDSILNESITRNTIDLEKKYETERKDVQIQLQQTEIKQQAILNYFLVASAIGLVIILLLSYRNYRGRQKLHQTKIDELKKEQHLNATEAMLKGEEQERTRLARELHDGLGGMLSGIKHSFVNMKETMVMMPENVQAFGRNLDMLDTSIREMRRVAHNLMPEILVKYGLNVALKEFCNDISRSGVIPVVYQPMGLERTDIGLTTSLAVYRIVQELVHNAIKHAAAKTVLVQLHASEQDKILSVTVEDDGKGFDRDALDYISGIGWINIRNRIDFLKGRVDINSVPGGGTSVLVEIDI